MLKCGSCGREYNQESDFMTKTSRWRADEMGNLYFNCDCNSTLLIRKDKLPFYSPEKFMSDEAMGVFNRLAVKDKLPLFPSAMNKLLTLASDAETENHVIIKELKKHPVIAAGLLSNATNLKAARDPFGGKVESLEHALTYVGRSLFKDLVQISTISSFEFDCPIFDQEAFWQESMLTATICEALVSSCKLAINADECYLSGSLLNVGKIVSAIVQPDVVEEICQNLKSVKFQSDWYGAEKKIHAFKHTILGEIAAAIWGLPDFISDAAKYHHDPEDYKASSERPHIVDVACLANLLKHWVRLEPQRINDALLQKQLKIFGMSMADLENFISEQKFAS